jgi:hypothetical protein
MKANGETAATICAALGIGRTTPNMKYNNTFSRTIDLRFRHKNRRESTRMVLLSGPTTFANCGVFPTNGVPALGLSATTTTPPQEDCRRKLLSHPGLCTTFRAGEVLDISPHRRGKAFHFGVPWCHTPPRYL